MLISEIYCSRQGEGRLTGTPSVFLRTSGCNLRCDFCDTPFTSWNSAGEKRSIAEIVDQVVAASTSDLPARADGVLETDDEGPARHVVLTGGEPLLPPDVVGLCDQMSDAGFHITIETAGTIDRDLKCQLMSISPKLSNSTPSIERAGQWAERHESTRFRPGVVATLIQSHDYQLKFVVAEEADITEVESYLIAIEKHDVKVDRSKVLLMPEGIDSQTLQLRKVWLEPVCEKLGFVFCERKHIIWYGNKRAT